MQGMNTLDPAFGSINVQPAMAQIDLSPTQRAEFLGSQPMPIRQEDCSSVPWAIPPTFASSVDQPINLAFC
jgi:hypothetical protein